MNEVIIHGRKVVDHDDEVVIRNISTHSMRNLIVITAVLFIFHGMGFIATWFIFRCLYFCFNSTSWRFHAKTETWSLFVSPFHQNFRIWTYNLGLINMKLFPPYCPPKNSTSVLSSWLCRFVHYWEVERMKSWSHGSWLPFCCAARWAVIWDTLSGRLQISS